MSEPIEITAAMVFAFGRVLIRRIETHPNESAFETSRAVLEVAFAIHAEAIAEKQKARGGE